MCKGIYYKKKKILQKELYGKKHTRGKGRRAAIMSGQMENAKNLYLRGIRDGAVQEVQDCYMGESYAQHSTGVPEGKEGFRTFFEDFFRRNPKQEKRRKK